MKMYLQKCEEYSGREVYGSDENDELYKGLVSFMIVSMKDSATPVHETKINGGWLKEQILDCLNTQNRADSTCEVSSVTIIVMYQLIRCYLKAVIKIQIAYLCFTNHRKFTCFLIPFI